MTDHEMIMACGRAAGLSPYIHKDHQGILVGNYGTCMCGIYNPLTNDTQCMELVKKFELSTCAPSPDDKRWQVSKIWGTAVTPHGYSTDLNRAICECVAKNVGERQ